VCCSFFSFARVLWFEYPTTPPLFHDADCPNRHLLFFLKLFFPLSTKPLAGAAFQSTRPFFRVPSGAYRPHRAAPRNPLLNRFLFSSSAGVSLPRLSPPLFFSPFYALFTHTSEPDLRLLGRKSRFSLFLRRTQVILSLKLLFSLLQCVCKLCEAQAPFSTSPLDPGKTFLFHHSPVP